MAKRPPNIVWIMCDQMRFDCAGFAGHPLVKTPRLDRVAADSVVFENAYCASPVCSPARASWLTGLYPHAHGQLRNYSSPRRDNPGTMMRADCVTIGDVLKQAGYRCGIVGPWHMGNDHQPQHGFTDFWYAYRYQGGHGDRFFEYLDEQGVANLYRTNELPPHINQEIPGMHHGVYHDPREQRTTWTIERGLEFLDGADDRPSFLFLSVKDPHAMIIVPPELLELYPPDQIDLPQTWRDPLVGKPPFQLTQPRRLPEDVDDDAFRRMMAHYYAMVTHIDAQVGRVIDKLHQMDQWQDTIFVFMSDHGEMLGAHGSVTKVVMYEESAKVPCVLSYPRHLPAGLRVQTTLAGVDLMPTILDLAAMALPEPIDGRSVSDALRRSRQPPPQPIFAELCNWEGLKFKSDAPQDLAACAMVLDGHTKLVWNRTEIDELYDLAADPIEMKNLINEPDQAERAGEMRRMIGEMVQHTGPGPYDWCLAAP